MNSRCCDLRHRPIQAQLVCALTLMGITSLSYVTLYVDSVWGVIYELQSPMDEASRRLFLRYALDRVTIWSALLITDVSFNF